VEVLRPHSLREALDAVAAHPDAELLAGGTDLMVEINFGRKRPETIVLVQRLPELQGLDRNGRVHARAGVTYTQLLNETADSFRAMREMSRTVGSPQIRNAGTLGGNLGTSSPAGDALPVLAAYDAEVILTSRSGERRLPFGEFMTGPKRSARRPDEIVVAVEWRDPGAAQTFMKVGTRNAMVIAIASLCLVVDRAGRAVRVALGSCGPTIIRAGEAERFAEGLCDESGWDEPLSASDVALARFGEFVAAAARPIDDVRGTAAYRRHVLAVMARRALARVGAVVG
jgi:CO/xanthine dehydrogenase FAD-binding subunit